MISVSMSITEGAVTRRVSIRAATLQRALRLAGYGREDRLVSVKASAPASELLAERVTGESPRPEHAPYGAVFAAA